MSSYIYGVWQGGLCLTYVGYQQSTVVVGTHVGNYPEVIKAIWSGSDYSMADITYDITYCNDAETYIIEFGATYAATYFREISCNVRSLEWV